MGNAAGSLEAPQGKEGKASPGCSRRQTKLPMPPEAELELRFDAVLVRRMWNMLEMCKSSEQAYHSDGDTVSPPKHTKGSLYAADYCGFMLRVCVLVFATYWLPTRVTSKVRTIRKKLGDLFRFNG